VQVLTYLQKLAEVGEQLVLEMATSVRRLDASEVELEEVVHQSAGSVDAPISVDGVDLKPSAEAAHDCQGMTFS